MAEGVDLSKMLTGGSEELIDVCCSPCSEDGIYTEAEKYCIDCEMYYCGKCLIYHNRIPSSRGHQIVDKSQAEAGSTKTPLPAQRCLTHQGKLVDMYCADHDVLCCGACVAVTHRTCIKVDYLSDVSRGIKESQEFNDVKDMLQLVNCELEREKTKMKHILSSLGNESETVLAEINHHEEDLISKIRVRAQKTRESLNIKLTEGRETLEEDIKNITSAMATISLNEENISNGNEAEIFAKVKHGKITVKDCKVLLTELSGRSNHKKLRFVANKKLQSDVNESKHIGTVSLLEEQKNKNELKINAEEQITDSSNTKEKINGEKLTVEVGEEKKKDPEVLQYTARLYGKYKVNEIPCVVTSLCVLDNKSLMLFDYTNVCLKRLRMDDFVIINILELQGASYSICSVGTEEVAVALYFNKKIQLVSVGRTMTLTRSFNTDYYCYGVAFIDVSGEFYVSNSINQVNVYDKNGKLMKTYDKDGKGRYMLSATRNVAWNEDRTILYVTDMVEGLIALNMSGDLLWTFSDAELKYAHGLCVLPGDVILVSVVNSNNIIQVDTRGKKIGTLLGAEDNLNRPYALAYDRNRSRLILSHNSKEIHIYNLETK